MNEVILMVDDDARILRTFARNLRLKECTVLTAENGEAALSIYERERPDFVLSDMRMPGMDGVELLHAIRDLDPQADVILTTGHGEKDAVIEALRGGASDFVPKPIDSVMLESMLRRARDRQTLKRKLQSSQLALRESEARYRALVEQIPAITYTAALDEGSTTLYVSPQVETYLGYTIEEYRADPDNWYKNLHPDDRERVLHELERSHEQGTPFTSEYRMLNRNGDTVWLRDEATIIETEPGRPLLLQGIMYDITARKKIENELEQYHGQLEDLVAQRTQELTRRNAQLRQEIAERKRAERALHDSQNFLESLINSIEGALWEADAETFQFTFVSERAEDLLGYPRERWLQEPTFWIDHVHPEDQTWVMGFCTTATQEKRTHEFEYRMLNAEGKIVWLHDVVSVIVENGRPVKLRGAMIDITRRKHIEQAIQKREAQVRALIEYAYDAIRLIDEEGMILEWNVASENITGLRREEVIGQPIWDVLVHLTPDELQTPKLREMAKSQTRKFLKTGQPQPIGQHIVQRPDGTRRTVQTIVFPIKTDKGFMLGAISRDITELNGEP